MDDSLMTIKDYAKKLRLSKATIYRDPEKYHMFRVGGSWRASDQSLKKFEEDRLNNNNVYRLAVISGGRKGKCLSTKGVKHTGSMCPPQTERELEKLLAPLTR